MTSVASMSDKSEVKRRLDFGGNLQPTLVTSVANAQPMPLANIQQGSMQPRYLNLSPTSIAHSQQGNYNPASPGVPKLMSTSHMSMPPTSPASPNGVTHMVYSMPLSGNFTDDLDILALNNAILKHLEAEQKTALANKQQHLQNILDQSNRVRSEDAKKELLARYGQGWAELKSHESSLAGSASSKYQQETKDILTKYAGLRKYKSVITLGRQAKQTCNLSPEEIEQRVEIIERFLYIASRYAPVNYQCMRKDEAKCSACRCPLQVGDDMCPECGQILSGEIIVRMDAETPLSYPASITSSAQRAINRLKDNPCPKVSTVAIIEAFSKLSLSMAQDRLPGNYVIFKLAQIINDKVAPIDIGLGHSTRVRLDSYDTTWQPIAKANKLPFKTSF